MQKSLLFSFSLFSPFLIGFPWQKDKLSRIRNSIVKSTLDLVLPCFKIRFKSFSRDQTFLHSFVVTKVHRRTGRKPFIVYLWPSINKLDRLGIKNMCLHVISDFYLTQPSNKQLICFDFKKQNSSLPYNILCTLHVT